MLTIATAIIAAFTIVLSVATYWYARTTKRILLESQKSREATESLAESSRESIQLLKQQAEQAATIGRTIVAAAINAARTNIDQWRSLDIISDAVHSRLPETLDLLPDNAQAAIEHSRLISLDGSFDLISGFGNLRQATLELEIVSKTHPSDQGIMRDHLKRASAYMDKASADLEAATDRFAEAVPFFRKE
jgi:hypothetical protein